MVSCGVQKRAKSTCKFRLIGSSVHCFLNFEIWIVFTDDILYFQVVLYVREMPPYELLLQIFLFDPPWPKVRLDADFNTRFVESAVLSLCEDLRYRNKAQNVAIEKMWNADPCLCNVAVIGRFFKCTRSGAFAIQHHGATTDILLALSVAVKGRNPYARLHAAHQGDGGLRPTKRVSHGAGKPLRKELVATLCNNRCIEEIRFLGGACMCKQLASCRSEAEGRGVVRAQGKLSFTLTFFLTVGLRLQEG